MRSAAGNREARIGNRSRSPIGLRHALQDTWSSSLAENPRGYCPNHATGLKLPDAFVVKPLQHVD